MNFEGRLLALVIAIMGIDIIVLQTNRTVSHTIIWKCATTPSTFTDDRGLVGKRIDGKEHFDASSVAIIVSSSSSSSSTGGRLIGGIEMEQRQNCGFATVAVVAQIISLVPDAEGWWFIVGRGRFCGANIIIKKVGEETGRPHHYFGVYFEIILRDIHIHHA